MISFVICGVEHSGTTLVSDLFRQCPAVDAGFEVGVLLGSSPRRFPKIRPYARTILDGWDITPKEFDFCCDAESFADFYDRLQKSSRALKASTTRTFDKTPRYLAYLDSCLKKVPVPFVLMYKDPRAIVFSDFKRSGQKNFDAWFEGYAAVKLGYLRQLYANYRGRAARSKRVLRVSLEHLCLNPRTASERIFSHCGETFSLEYLLFKNTSYLGDRAASSISPRMPFEYMVGLTSLQTSMVLRFFSELDEWFYD